MAEPSSTSVRRNAVWRGLSACRQFVVFSLRKAVHRYRLCRGSLGRLWTHPIDEGRALLDIFRYHWRKNVFRGLEILEREGLDSAREYFAAQYRKRRLPAYRFYLDLYTYLADELAASEATAEEASSRPYIIHVPIWGPAAVDTFLRFMLPSLTAEGNLPAIAARANVELLIHCNETAASTIARHPALAAVEPYCTVRLRPFPDHLVELVEQFPKARWCAAKYHLYGNLQALATYRASMQGAAVSFFNADFVLTQNSLEHALDMLDSGKLAVLATSFRCLLPGIGEALERFRQGQALELPADEATPLQVRHMHPAARARVVSDTTEHFTLTAQMLFQDEHGVAVRAFHYHPMIVDGSALARRSTYTFMTADSHLLINLLPPESDFEKLVHVVEDPRQLNFLELSELPVERVPWRRVPRLSQQQLRTMLTPHLRWATSIPLQRFLLSKRPVFCARSSAEQPTADVVFLREAGFGFLTTTPEDAPLEVAAVR